VGQTGRTWFLTPSPAWLSRGVSIRVDPWKSVAAFEVDFPGQRDLRKSAANVTSEETDYSPAPHQ